MRNNFIEVLKKEALNHDLNLNDNELQTLDTFRRELIYWNNKVNLTRIVDDEDFAIKHVIDSLMIFKKADIQKGASLIDIGTGAGIPGIILKIVRPDLKVDLLESQRKKADFLEYVVDKLSLGDVQIINDRAEAAARKSTFREKYDISIARAVSALNVLCEYCLPFVKVGGLFLSMKGEAPTEEISQAKDAIKILGGKLHKSISYTLGRDMSRTLIIISKEKACPKKYPRRPGIPNKNPL